MMAMFAGPDRNRNIMITVAVVVIAVLIFLYTTGRLPGIGSASAEAASVGGLVTLTSSFPFDSDAR